MALLTVPGTSTAAQSTERLYEEACRTGDMIACNVFGLMLETGEGVGRDLPRAADFFQRACEGGELVGCTNVGLLYAAGVGLPADRTRATGFLRVACEGGEQLGCTLLRDLDDASGATPPARHDKVGRVGDADSGRPLAEAVIALPELDLRVISDGEGRFVLTQIPEGRHSIRGERLGYDALEGVLEVPGNPEFVMLMTPAELVDPGAPGQIVGHVTEASERGLADVEVSVVGQERARTLSNQQGRFSLRDVEPGLVVVRFVRIGYAPRTATLVVQPGRTAELSATMAVEPIEIEPVEVTVRLLDLEREGFYDRADRGFGRFFTPGELAALQPVLLSDAFRGRVAGVTVVQDVLTGTTRLESRRSSSVNQGPCTLPVYVDGVPMLDANVDLWPPEAILAVEAYVGAETPIQYSGGGSGWCGAVLLWTRRGS